MNRSAELQLCAGQKRAKLELRAPILRFMVPIHAHRERGLSMNPRAAASRQSAAKSFFGTCSIPTVLTLNHERYHPFLHSCFV